MGPPVTLPSALASLRGVSVVGRDAPRAELCGDREVATVELQRTCPTEIRDTRLPCPEGFVVQTLPGAFVTCSYGHIKMVELLKGHLIHFLTLSSKILMYCFQMDFFQKRIFKEDVVNILHTCSPNTVSVTRITIAPLSKLGTVMVYVLGTHTPKCRHLCEGMW